MFYSTFSENIVKIPKTVSEKIENQVIKSHHLKNNNTQKKLTTPKPFFRPDWLKLLPG